jgi:serine/threonine-protein kinase
MIACPACQTPSDGSQKFCPKCGAMLPTQAGPDPLIGQVLGGKYRIAKLLGEGGMGAVYLGEQQMGTKTRNVAIKTLHKHLSQDPHINARFMRECGTLSELEHPNTIQVYDFGKSDDGLLYVVMEYVQGADVATVLEKGGPMPPERVQKILTQVCGSLEEAHKRGIVHRDLKPENVVLCERAGQTDWVEVLDFGIAKRQEESDPNEQKLTQQGMVLGTPPYMSPEQFTGKPIDARSDIYALGVMAYEMLTGKLPFVAQTAWEWATQHMTAPPIEIDTHPNAGAIPPHMKATIKKAMEKLPENRYSSVREFIEALTAGHVQPIAAPPVGGTAVLGPSPPTSGMVREKTQIGEPMVAPAATGGQPAAPATFGPAVAPSPPAGPPPGAAPAPAYAQAGGGGGGGKGPLLAILGGLGVLCIIGIVLGITQPWKKKTEVALDFDAGTGGGTTNLLGDDAASGATAQNDPPPDDDAGSGLSALSSAKPVNTNVVQPKRDGGAAAAPKDGGGAKPIPTPTPTQPAGPMPQSCVAAIKMREQGKTQMFEMLKEKCIKEGGKI